MLDFLGYQIGNNTCNGVDIVYGNGTLHIVWATKDNGDYYETYYRPLTGNNWGSTENVTNYNRDEVGGFPTVSISPNRVHVSYNNGIGSDPEVNMGTAKTRDKYQDQWQPPQIVYDTYSMGEKIFAGSSKLFDFYYELVGGMGNYHADLYVKERTFSGTEWPGSGTFLQTYADVSTKVSSASTADGKTHIVYVGSSNVVHRSYNGTSWSDEFTVGDYYFSPKVSSYSKDLFVTWASDNYVLYRQYDDAPLAPANLILINYNGHPKLQWSANQEPDFQLYTIYRDLNDGQGFVLLTTTTNLYYIDYTVNLTPPGGEAGHEVFYKITASDIESHESGYSNTVKCNVPGKNPQKIIGDSHINNIQCKYKLEQNYPNPFNPATSISYSLEKNGLISLKVYDMLGREVAELVNENQPKGYYKVEFNAADLPSGVYFYQLKTREYTAIKKMLLIK